jgi:hypothetical protein
MCQPEPLGQFGKIPLHPSRVRLQNFHPLLEYVQIPVGKNRLIIYFLSFPGNLPGCPLIVPQELLHLVNDPLGFANNGGGYD